MPTRPNKPSSSRPAGAKPAGKSSGKPAKPTGGRAGKGSERPRPSKAKHKTSGARPPRPGRPGAAAERGEAAAAPKSPRGARRPANRPTGAAAGRPRGATIKAEAGMPLARYVVLQSGDAFSVRDAKRLLEQGICRVNGRVETFGSRVLEQGDVVELVLPDHAPEKTRLELERDRIVHVDDAIIVYDKPPGLAVTPPDKKQLNDGGKRSLSLLALIQERYPEARAVHRIDADTTGLVVFARSPEVKAALETGFKEHTVEKLYLALVRGVPRAEGTHRSFMVKVEAGLGFEKWASGHGEGSREAVTSWKVVERLGAWASLVEVRPETGRHHQIRIHMKELGHPLIGDTRYGDRRDPVPAGLIPRHMLHAAQMTFDHPLTQKRIVLKARPPIDFIAAEEVLRKAK